LGYAPSCAAPFVRDSGGLEGHVGVTACHLTANHCYGGTEFGAAVETGLD